MYEILLSIINGNGHKELDLTEDLDVQKLGTMAPNFLMLQCQSRIQKSLLGISVYNTLCMGRVRTFRIESK